MNMQRHRNVDNRAVFGGIMILLGLALVLYNLDFMPWWLHNIIFSWQMLLIALGAVFYIGRRERPVGLILMVVGGFFLIPELVNTSYNFERFFWPVILIALGVIILRRRHDFSFAHKTKEGDSTDVIDEMNIFGGGERLITSKNFKGGKVTCVFGGAELNFTNAQLAEGTNVLDVFTMFGGCTLIVPSDWNIKVDITSVFGGFSDKRVNPVNYIVEPKKELIIRGLALFGGGDIKSYK